jgi:hypothetical protein
MRIRFFHILILIGSFFMATCDANTDSLAIFWGGSDIALDLSKENGAVYFSGCREGKLDSPIILDQDGHFSVSGQYTITAGPGRTRPARYEGSVKNDVMSLTIQLTDTGEKLDPFSLKPVQVLPFGPSACL